jgi:uncharacterized protein YjbI with pentapeptide repeats
MKKTMETILYHDHNNAINTGDYSFRKRLAENKFFIYDRSIREKFEDYDQYRKFLDEIRTFDNKEIYSNDQEVIETYGSIFEICYFKGTFKKCNFSGTTFKYCCFVGVEFNDMFMCDTDFRYCNFVDCIFKKTTLRKSIVKNCAFKNPIFLDTILDFSTVKKPDITFDLNNKKVVRKRVDDYSPLYCYAISTTDKE